MDEILGVVHETLAEALGVETMGVAYWSRMVIELAHMSSEKR